MKDGPDIARIAALIGDPARATMLTALMSGRALTATELAAEAGVTPQTASSHLARLTEGGLLRQQKQGRHKYLTLAGDEVGRLLEMLMGVAAGAGHLRSRTGARTGPADPALRRARVCYNHLAGDLGTQMFDALMAQGVIQRRGDALQLTDTGRDFASDFGISLASLSVGRAPLCRECLDWSERRAHLSGSLGRALLARFVTLGWASRQMDSRAIRFSTEGEQAFRGQFGLTKV